MPEYVTDPRELVEIYSKLTGLNSNGLTLQRLVGESPLIEQCLLTGALNMKGALSPSEWREISVLVSGLILLFLRSHAGKDLARDQIEVLHRFIFPKKYRVHEGRIKELARTYRNTSLSRGWALRELMGELTSIVVSARASAKNVLDGAVCISTEPTAKEHPLYVKALEHWIRGTTLQMLAIRIYLEREQVARAAEGKESTLDVTTLKRDLRKVREWEKTDLEHSLIKTYLMAKDSQSTLPVQWLIPTRLFSESALIPTLLFTDSEQIGAKKSE